jgi:hypothetical protein
MALPRNDQQLKWKLRKNDMQFSNYLKKFFFNGFRSSISKTIILTQQKNKALAATGPHIVGLNCQFLLTFFPYIYLKRQSHEIYDFWFIS